jgi:hypothetical protein
MPDLNAHRSKHVYFFRDQEETEKCLILPLRIPDGFCVKVFYRGDWQGEDPKDLAIIQNIFAAYGMAPRVIKFFEVIVRANGAKALARISEYLGEESGYTDERADQFMALAEKLHIRPYTGECQNEIRYNQNNWRSGKYVDFGGFKWIDQEAYRKELMDRIQTVTHFGKSYNGRKASYQSIDIKGWELDGKRKMASRIDALKLNQINFHKKSVMDIGCNLGLFLHYAVARGADDLVGYDRPEVIQVAREFASCQRQFEIDFQARELGAEPPTRQADIVFFLAMSEYLGFPDWLKDVTKQTLLYEGHSKEKADETKVKLSRLFRSVDYLGEINDRGNRPLFVCTK